MMTQAETYVWVSDAEASDYSATLTGNPLLFRETRLLLALIAGGLNDEETAARIVDQNLFQYRSTKSITKRVNALISRFAGVPSDIRAFIVDAPLSEARLVLILVLAVRDRLFREFVQEVVLFVVVVNLSEQVLAKQMRVSRHYSHHGINDAA